MYTCYKQIFVLVILVTISYSGCIQCTNSEFGTTIHEIYGLQEFLDHIFFYHNSDSKIITYQECNIPRVVLPTEKKLKELSLLCI